MPSDSDGFPFDMLATRFTMQEGRREIVACFTPCAPLLNFAPAVCPCPRFPNRLAWLLDFLMFHGQADVVYQPGIGIEAVDEDMVRSGMLECSSVDSNIGIAVG